MNKKDKYKAIHEEIIKSVHESKPKWIKGFMTVCNKTATTNTYCLVVTPKIGDYTDFTDRVKAVYPMPIKYEKILSYRDLKDKLESIPKVIAYNKDERECDACDGFGEVKFYFEYKGREYDKECECPICDGSGIIETKTKNPNKYKDYDYTKYIKIGENVFSLYRFLELLMVAEIMEVDKIRFVSDDKENKCLFIIDEVEVILMPSINVDESKIVHSII